LNLPEAELRPPPQRYAGDLDGFIRQHDRLFVLSGAGISTDSGIPGYRDDNGEWKRSPPVQWQDFLRSASTRQRYWARSMVGWPVVARALPNPAHRALAQLEAAGRVRQLVTQNVDGLHQRAGSSAVIELHGNVSEVPCLDCGGQHLRADIQHTLEQDNPTFCDLSATPVPDGDADLESRPIEAFRVPTCPSCRGMLKPAVVFFGESVPRQRVDDAVLALERADAMLVVGSSLMVYSGYRFCEWAKRMGKPIAAINLGRTRADHLFSVKVEASCAAVLAPLAASLS
jgi:NAD-dependent SIR2 family protein deacetylase